MIIKVVVLVLFLIALYFLIKYVNRDKTPLAAESQKLKDVRDLKEILAVREKVIDESIEVKKYDQKLTKKREKLNHD